MGSGAGLGSVPAKVIIILGRAEVGGEAVANEKLRVVPTRFPGTLPAKKAFDNAEPEGLYLFHDERR